MMYGKALVDNLLFSPLGMVVVDDFISRQT
jgi:hypothetical protein